MTDLDLAGLEAELRGLAPKPRANDRPAKPERTPQQLLTQIRWDVNRLALNTLAPPMPGTRNSTRRPITQDPLLARIRDAIRPDQGGTGQGRSGSSSDRTPIDEDALEIYEDLSGQIASMYETATDRRAHATPEQQLIEWFYAFQAHDPNHAQLTNYAEKLSRWRRRLESHFDPPREREYPLCPRCGYSHFLSDQNGYTTQRRCLVLTYWPETHRALAECRHCGETWFGQIHPSGATAGIQELHDELDQNIEEYGPFEFVLATPGITPVPASPGPSEATTIG